MIQQAASAGTSRRVEGQTRTDICPSLFTAALFPVATGYTTRVSTDKHDGVRPPTECSSAVRRKDAPTLATAGANRRTLPSESKPPRGTSAERLLSAAVPAASDSQGGRRSQGRGGQGREGSAGTEVRSEKTRRLSSRVVADGCTTPRVRSVPPSRALTVVEVGSFTLWGVQRTPETSPHKEAKFFPQEPELREPTAGRRP